MCHEAISFCSCRNRRSKELLPTSYVHVVFTIPHELSWLALQNKKVVYDLLFRTSAATLLEVAADPKHLGAEIGFLSVLHTWGQTLQHHPHIHCVIPSGGLSPDHQHWVHPRYPFFLPVPVLRRVFRGKFVAGLKSAFHQGKLVFPGSLQPMAAEKSFAKFLRPLFRKEWVVYAKRPFGGPEHVLHYLARYTHRVAISNHRLLSVADGKVTFRWKDYAQGSKQRKMTVTAEEFLRRFMLHVLPLGFIRIRFSGFLANRHRKQLLPLCQTLLGARTTQPSESLGSSETKPLAAWRCLVVVATWSSSRNLLLNRSDGGLLTGSISLTVRSRHSLSDLERASTRAFHVCPYRRQRVLRGGKRGPSPLPTHPYRRSRRRTTTSSPALPANRSSPMLQTPFNTHRCRVRRRRQRPSSNASIESAPARSSRPWTGLPRRGTPD
uniref:Putative transposase n=1 Tax=Solibacter usitatus (strain Ellin6076) TaxID=234267 RepID=Q01XA5_SOLUE